MHCVSCVTIGLIDFVSDSAPSSSHSSMTSSYMDVPFYGSITLRGCRSLLEIVLVGQCEVFVCLGFGHFILFVYFFPWPRSS